MISLLLSFFLALSFFLLSAAIAVKSSYLPGNMWSSYLLHSSYGDEAAEAAREHMEEVFESRGLSEEAAGRMLTQEALRAEYGYCVDDLLQKRKQEKSRREIFEEELESQIMEYLQEAAITEQLETEILNLVEETGDIYDSYLNPGWLASMISFAEKYDRILTVLIVLSAAVIVLESIILWFMHHYKHKAVRYIVYGAGTSCLWGALLLLFLWKQDWIEELGAGPEYYCRFIDGLWEKALQGTMAALAVEAVSVLVLALWMKHLKHRTN